MGSKQEDLRFIEQWVEARLREGFAPDAPASDALEPLAIVGLSGYFPGAMDVASFWRSLDHDERLITEIPDDRFDWRTYYDEVGEADGTMRTRWGGFIPDVATFDPAFFGILPLEAREMDPRQRLLLMSTWHTLEDAGYNPDELAKSRTGVFVGCEANEYAQRMRLQNVRSRGLFNEADSLIANRLSYHFDFAGPSEFINTMCSSFAVALHRAVVALRAGKVDRAIVGAANVMLLPEPFVALSQGDQLSSQPTVKSFGSDSDGYIRSEGAGTILIERLRNAEAANRFIYATVKHAAVNFNGQGGLSMAAPNAAAHCELMKSCYREAGIDPRRLTYVEAQGMGLPVADIAEWTALNRALTELCREQGAEPAAGYCRVSTLKPMAGHMHSASSMAALLKVIRSFHTNKLHKVLDFDAPNEYCDMKDSPCRILTETESWLREDKPRLAAVHSYGSGGNNAHLLLEEYINSKRETPTSGEAEVIVCLSARTRPQLERRVADLRDFLLAAKQTHLIDLSYTFATGRKSFEYRCAIVARSTEGLIASLEQIASGRPSHGTFVGRAVESETINLADRLAYVDLADLARRWVDGAILRNAQALYVDREVRSIPGLPGYPFEMDRCWFDDKGVACSSLLDQSSSPNEHGIPTAADKGDDLRGQDVRRRLVNYLRGALGVELNESTLHTPFSELGLDSLSVPIFVAGMQDEFGVELRRSDVFSYPTPERLAEFIAAAMRSTGDSVRGENPRPGRRSAWHDRHVERHRHYWHQFARRRSSKSS